MHTITISASTFLGEDIRLQRFAQQMKKIKQQKSRIYRMCFVIGALFQRYVLLTTSKDLYLELGSLDFDGQHNFVMFLIGESQYGEKHQQFMLRFQEKPEGSGKRVLITRSKEEEETIFILSPAH